MSFKISFRFERNASAYTAEHIQGSNAQIMNALHTLLSRLDINTTRVYQPSRNSVKAIFPNENELNKVFIDYNTFTRQGFYPRISMALKESRTIFCARIEKAVLSAFTNRDIKQYLQDREWEIVDVYIMRSKTSLKIQFQDTKQATKFLKSTNTSICNIMITQEHKEREINPTVQQCYTCGEINTNHGSHNCWKQPICLRCGQTDHKFYNCTIPQHINDMTQRHKQSRYCAVCKIKGNHTSLDHSACPKKREIVRERIRIEREKHMKETNNNERDIELIRTVFEYSNRETWPPIHSNTQHTQITTILSLALIEEAIQPGIFQTKLTESCRANNIPEVKYTLEQGTAKTFFQTLSGVGSTGNKIQHTQHHTQLSSQNSKGGQQTNSTKTKQEAMKPTQNLSKYCRDQMGGNRNLEKNLDLDIDIAQLDLPKKLKRRATPHKLTHSQSMQDLTLPTRIINTLGTTALTPSHQGQSFFTTPETLRGTEDHSELDMYDIYNISNTYNWELEENDFNISHTSEDTIASRDTSFKAHENYEQCMLCNKWIMRAQFETIWNNAYSMHVQNCEGTIE